MITSTIIKIRKENSFSEKKPNNPLYFQLIKGRDTAVYDKTSNL